MIINTYLSKPFWNNGLPTDYWILLSLVRNGEIYSRKELIRMTTLAAVKKLIEERFLINIGGSGKYAISAEGLAFFEMHKPVGALKRIPRTANVWKVTATKEDGSKEIFKHHNLQVAKKKAVNMVSFKSTKHIQIDPAAY